MQVIEQIEKGLDVAATVSILTFSIKDTIRQYREGTWQLDDALRHVDAHIAWIERYLDEQKRLLGEIKVALTAGKDGDV